MLQRIGSLLRTPANRWLPRRTVRMRLTALYGGLFLVGGALLLTVTYVLVASHIDGGGVSVSARPGKITVISGVPPLPGPVGPAGSPVGPFAVPNGAANGARLIQAAIDAQRSNDLNQLLVWSGTALGIMAIASVALGWVMAGRVLAPLRTMTATARQISADNLDARLSLTGPDDELKELGDTIDELLARLERAFDAQRRFVANASHELRTPLTLERAMIEVALADPGASIDSLREVCERVLAAGAEQERLIEALMMLARSQRGLDHREPVELDDVVADALELSVGPDQRRDLSVTSRLHSATVSGDRRLLQRLAANLLDNAVRHNVAHGWVHVTTEARNGSVTLHVINSGPVIPDEDVDRLLEPFRGAATDRSSHGQGHGLGLSIAAAIAHAHAAELQLRPRREGGLDVEVGFQLAECAVSPS